MPEFAFRIEYCLTEERGFFVGQAQRLSAGFRQRSPGRKGVIGEFAADGQSKIRVFGVYEQHFDDFYGKTVQTTAFAGHLQLICGITQQCVPEEICIFGIHVCVGC